MRRSAVLAFTLLAAAAPAATADDPSYDCTLHAYSTHGFDPVNKHQHQGVAYGYVAHAGDLNATIRCAVRVDGTEVSSTPAGTAVTAGAVTYRSSDSQQVMICAEATTTHGTTGRCKPVVATHLAQAID